MLNKNKGFTLIELLAVIVILAVIMLIITPIVIKVIEDAKRGAFKNSVYGIIKASELNYAKKLLIDNTGSEMQYSYQNGEETSETGDANLDYKGTKPESGTIIINSQGQITLALHNGKYCITKGYNNDDLILEEIDVDECLLDIKEIVYSVPNAPQLLGEMTPIYWEEDGNGNYIEKETDENDSNWYDYKNKKWANAKTKDGSYWVWIPRYAYKITNGFHQSVNNGTVDVRFLQGTQNIMSDDIPVETEGYNTVTKNTKDNFFLHPAFVFGEKPLAGFWTAKFESSVANQNSDCYIDSNKSNCNNDTLVPKIIPNVNSWRDIELATAYAVSLNMKSNNIYGWNQNEVDTHLMKNIEWGAIAYLSKSQYGVVGKVWRNSCSNFITGCSGEDEGFTITTNCIAYNTENGVKASTTHTIYGVYDMNGGASEYVMGNLLIDNNRTNKSANFEVDILKNMNKKYIDEYVNYNGINYGDAIYETSRESTGNTSWGMSYSYFLINNTHPWFYRGGSYNGSPTDVFAFDSSSGYSGLNGSFRPVVIHNDEN